MDFQGLPDFPLLEAGFVGQHPHIIEREAVARVFQMFEHSRMAVGGGMLFKTFAQSSGGFNDIGIVTCTARDLVHDATLVFFC